MSPTAEDTPAFSVDQYNAFQRSSASAVVDSVITKRIESIDSSSCELYGEDGFWIVDLDNVRHQMIRWRTHLPLVRPFYAVKCNPDPRILELLASPPFSAGFDCATHAEIEMMLSRNVPAQDIIYANPCKAPSHIRYASTVSVAKMTFDNATELHKIKRYFPNAECVLRIKTELDGEGQARYQLSKKYGVSVNGSRELLMLAKELELNVIGVAFHVGSAQTETEAYVRSISYSRKVWDIARDVGYDFRLLDIGGGFMHENFEEAAEKVRFALDKEFKEYIRRGLVQIIAEPGRFVCATAFSLVTNVIALREEAEDAATPAAQQKRMVYVTDGIYSNINAAMWPGELTFPEAVRGKRFQLGRRGSAMGIKTPISSASSDSGIDIEDYYFGGGNAGSDGGVGERMDGELQEYVIWGPTCDSGDVILKSAWMPRGIHVGDWLVFRGLGAYSTCMRTAFNGFSTEHNIIYLNE